MTYLNDIDELHYDFRVACNDAFAQFDAAYLSPSNYPAVMEAACDWVAFYCNA